MWGEYLKTKTRGVDLTDIYRTTIKKLLKKPVSKVIVGEKSDKEVFNNAVRVMEQEDSSYRVRFYVRMGEHRTHEEPERASSTGLPSSLPTGGMYFPFEDAGEETDDDDSDASDSGGSVDSGLSLPDDIDDTVVRLEGQGILIRDRASGRPTHVSIDYLNPKSLTGFSALAKYPDDASPQTPCY